MREDNRIVEISRPTFAELSSRLAKAGHTDLLDEDGTIKIGGFVLSAGDRASRARLAAQIADASTPVCPPDAIWEDGHIRVTSKCLKDGTHLTVKNEDNATSATVVIPRAALMPVAADMVECLSRDALEERVDDGMQT